MRHLYKGTSHGIAVLLFAIAVPPDVHCAGDASVWLNSMQPITPRSYVCRHTDKPVIMNGKLEAAAWAAAPWTEDFLDIRAGAKPKPRLRTRAKMLWDDDNLYIGAELEEPHVWGIQTNHDSVIFLDPDFEVFMDPKGETQPYYEFEINALNTTWDLLLDKPYMDGGKPHNEWEIPGAKSVVHIRGTINQPGDKDKGWIVEIAFPWHVLSERARHTGSPNEGEQWRIGFSRVEWQITRTNGVYRKIPNTPEDNWVWSPQGVVDMHRPEMWGVVQFTREPPSKKVPATPIMGKHARDLALGVYYAQRDFWSAHKSWSTNLAELNLDTRQRPSGRVQGAVGDEVTSPATAEMRANQRLVTSSPTVLRLSPGVGALTIEATADGYVCSVAFQSGGQQHVWRVRQDRLLKLDEPMPVETDLFIAQAAKELGDVGRRAAYFLVDNMPAQDRATLSRDFLMENLRLALKARQEFGWAKNVPERVFFNDVLPYASLDEPRDSWRAEFYKLSSEIVRGCTNATQAVQALNRDLFNRIKVHYNVGRKRNNQSPAESIAQGKATCTGLAIILADACRAVGVPARIAGVPKWAQKDGNHTWTEIWDGDWFFTGADEYDAKGLNRAWFNSDAAQTVRSENRINHIYASSWRRTGDYFPLAWDSRSHEVPGVNVSARYAVLEAPTNLSATTVHVRLREQEGGDRLLAEVELRSPQGEILARDRTRAGTADLNDMPGFTLPERASSVTFRFIRESEAREKTVPAAACMASHTLDFIWSDLAAVPPSLLAVESWLGRPATDRGAPPDQALSREEAARAISLAWLDLNKRRADSAASDLAAKQIVLGDKTLKWLEKSFGDAPAGKRTLWITLHGGGQGTAEENDRNWRSYFGRYEFPPGSINVAPRAPANTWDMWHVAWVDDLFDRLIADFVLKGGVDPNRVYLMGYSAGGDGVYQLAPRMSDRFASATMCAGHPNKVTPEGLRNLPFFLYMGGDDSAYNRNVVVREFSAKMDALQTVDPAGYFHRLTVYPGLPHGMQNREAEAIARMTAHSRVNWPRRVVWKQDDVTHPRFYWLERPADAVKPYEIYAAHVEGQTITIENPAKGNMTLRLSDELLDLDKPVRILAADRTIFEGKVPRSFAAVAQSLDEREDANNVASAMLKVSW